MDLCQQRASTPAAVEHRLSGPGLHKHWQYLWWDLVTWQTVFFTPIISHFTLPSLPHKFIYVCQLCSLPLFCYCIASKKSSLSFCSYSRPSELWKSTCGHDLHSRIILRCSLRLLCGGGRCCEAPARAAGLAWLPACGTVGGFVSTQVCAGALCICWSAWRSGDTALFCNELWCSNAPHTPSSRGEADVPLAFQSYCAASWAKGMKYTRPILISSIDGDCEGKCAAPQWKLLNSADLSDSMLSSICALISAPLVASNSFRDAQACSLSTLCCLCCCLTAVSWSPQWLGRANVV